MESTNDGTFKKTLKILSIKGLSETDLRNN